MDTRQKKEYLDSFPIQRLLGIGAPEITFYNTPTGYQALCPFHADKHLGSFIFNPYTGIWKCFSCGEGGRGVYKFVMQLRGWNFSETVKYLYDHKDDPVSPIATTIPTALLGKSRVTSFIMPSSSQKPKPKVQISQKEKFLNHAPLTPLDINRIYKSFAAASPLSENEVAKLRAKRGLTYLSVKDFFRFPSNQDTSFWSIFREMLQMYDELTGEERLYHSLIGVPGFYWDVDENRPAFISLKGSLGILSHSTDGLVNGIEIRTRAENGDSSRYISFSSASICLRNPERCIMGTKSDTIVDVVPKAYKESKGIAITEGKFKAIHLSYHGYTALNVRGISNWQKVLPVLKTFEGKKVTIAFDADMKRNPSVAKTAAKLARALMEEGYETEFLSWPIRYGKGFDDLCNAGWYCKAVTVPAERFLVTTIDPFLERAKLRKQQQKQTLV